MDAIPALDDVELVLFCQSCGAQPARTFVDVRAPDLVRGVQGYKPAIARGGALCACCGTHVALNMRMPCVACRHVEHISLAAPALWEPDAQQRRNGPPACSV